MRLPGILEHVEAVAGRTAALQLAREFGGTMISVSDAPGAALVRIVGQAAASTLVERLAREKVWVPMAGQRGAGGRRAQAAAMFAAGATTREVALAADIHQRTAKRVKAQTKTELPLFERREDKRKG